MTRARTGWADAATVKAAVKIKWDRGDLLRDLHAADPDRTMFPLRVRLTGPTRDEIPARFADAAAWAQALAEAATRDGWQLLTRPVRLSGLGTQQMPVAPHPVSILMDASRLGLTCANGRCQVTGMRCP